MACSVLCPRSEDEVYDQGRFEDEKYPKDYVLPIRCGGYANQWFQVMAGEIYAMANNKTCVIIRESLNPHNSLHQEYEKMVFRRTKFIDTDIIPFKTYTLFPQIVGYEAWEPWYFPGNVVLKGYYQYYPLLEQHKEFVLKYFYEGLKEFLVPPTMKIFLHVRRGDYVNSVAHPLCSDTYYRKSLKLFSDEIREYGICVFSDDIDWCRGQEFLKNIPKAEFIDEPNELKVMGLMVSCCGGAICSNSTYAWLGAFCGAHQAKNIVTVPKKWFNLKDASNLIPRDWVVVEE